MAIEKVSADAVLARIKAQERARLRIYIGAAPGVGNTYTMLNDAHRMVHQQGIDVTEEAVPHRG